MDSLVGRPLGRYRVLAELGRGGMGVVYRALDTSLDREVALKVLPADVVDDEDRRRRFLREAQTASRLAHAHIGVIHEVGEADGVSFIAMELLRGAPLTEAIARGSLAPARALEIATEIAEGLSCAHEQGIVHRDLKPANVMLTDDGHAKIIDFGLAKSLDAGALSPEAGTVATSTVVGVIKGTAAYMSPEQTRGERVDARSDVFSFGVMLYQLLSGRLPFQAASYVDTLHAISHDPAPPLVLAGPGVPEDVRPDLQRLLDKCLAKDPAARYQTTRDLVVDLRSARRRLDSAAALIGMTAVTRASTSSRARVAWAVWAIPLALAAAGVFWWTRRAPPPPPPLAASGKPSVAVLYFQNNTGSPQLDWLRTGLTDMVVTDLSQSAETDVLGTDRLFQILASLKRQNDPVLSYETIREVARLAGVRHVLVGNYVKAGDTIRINVTLQEADSGRILTADHLEASGEANLFPTVDTLTRRLQAKLANTSANARPKPLIPAPSDAPPGSGLYRDLQDVTTSSIDAYRAYAQGVALLESGNPRAAEPRLLEAITIDPDFALAMARLAAVENNLRRPDRRAFYAKAALDRADRLSPRDRYYLEGFFYSSDENTVQRGIDAYKKLLQLYPDHYAGSHNLANTYAATEQYEEAAVLGEGLRRSRFVLPISLSNLAVAYARLDRYEQAMDVVAESERRFPDAALTARQRGDVSIIFGQADEATKDYDRASSRDPRDQTYITDRLTIALFQRRWSEAERLAGEIGTSSDPFMKFAGAQSRALMALYRGKSIAALRLLEAATRGPGPWGATFDAALHLQAADTYLQLGQPSSALVHANAARRQSGDQLLTPMALGQLYAGIALNQLGRQADAKAVADELATRAAAVDGPRLKRLSSLLMGAVALDDHDLPSATAAFRDAERMLPARSSVGPPPSQPEVWFRLGSAYLAAGNDAEAEHRFLLVTTRVEPVLSPIEYVRSLYLLGQIAERRGDLARARQYYLQFVQLWGDGDIDRDRLSEARKKIR